MNYEELDKLLFEYTDLEKDIFGNNFSEESIKEAILNQKNSPDTFYKENVYFSNVPTDHTNFFYNIDKDRVLKLNIPDESYVITRHTRFASMINHTHDMFEMSYVYSGTFQQKIQGNTFELQQGDVLFLNKNVEHSISKCNEEDILINFLAKENFFDSQFISQILGDEILGKTVGTIISNSAKEKNFLLFRTGDNWRIKQTIQNILCEAFDKNRRNPEIIKAYTMILISRLLECENYETYITTRENELNISIVELLAYIEENFLDLTLEKTAHHFQFSPSHLGKLIKKVTGKTFTAIVQELKFKKAALLLQLTDEPIENIANEIGYNNLTFFYKKFHAHFGYTPQEYRGKVFSKQSVGQ